MNRIDISSKGKRVLPLTYNGKDFDIEIDTADVALTSFLLGMADEYQKLHNAVLEKAKSNNVEVLREVANEALNCAEEFYYRFCEICPAFKDATEGKPLRNFNAWGEILSACSDLITEGKAMQNIEGKIAEESSDTIEE